MKNIKKAIYIIATSICIISLEGCQDWLEMPSETKYDTSSTFQSLSKAEMAALGAYGSITHSDLVYRFANATDELVDDFGNDDGRSLMGQFKYDASNVAQGIFDISYPCIERTNMCLKYLPNAPVNGDAEQQLRNRLMGEMYALRAYSYFNVVRFWGDMPFFTEPAEDRENLLAGRVDRDLIYDQCIADLQEAVRLLPWMSEASIPVERLSKQAAYGLLARVALHAAGYSLRWDLNTYDPASLRMAKRPDAARITELYGIARNACLEVMQKQEHALSSGYEQLFRDLLTKTANREYIWQEGRYGVNQPALDGWLGYVIGININDKASIYNNATPQVYAMPTFWFEYAHDTDWTTKDTRRDVNLCNYKLVGANAVAEISPWSDRGAGKYRVVWKKDMGYANNKRDINMPILRYADILLMFAEAENELNGPTAEARNALKEVLDRACGANQTVYPIPSSKEDFFREIVRQRKLELCYEVGSLRRTDLIRWGIFYKTMSEEKAKFLRLVNHTDEYASVPRWVAYKKVVFDQFEHPLVSLPVHKYYIDEPDATEKAQLETQGYSLTDLYGGAGKMGSISPWVNRFFPGLTENKVEIMCFSKSMMNDNPLLAEQQHPLYK